MVKIYPPTSNFKSEALDIFMYDQENNLSHHILSPPLPVNNHLGAASGMSLRSQSSQARSSARPTSAMLLGASDLRALLRPATSLRGTIRGSIHNVIFVDIDVLICSFGLIILYVVCV
jgi:hypothetical protein